MNVPLLRRVSAGDVDARHECIARYGALVWTLARRLTNTDADAEHATQEIFVELWHDAANFAGGDGSEIAYVAIMARRHLLERRYSGDLAPRVTAIDAQRPNLALGALRPEHREVLELGIFHGLTHAAIARRLDLPLGSIKSFMRLGLSGVVKGRG